MINRVSFRSPSLLRVGLVAAGMTLGCGARTGLLEGYDRAPVDAGVNLPDAQQSCLNIVQLSPSIPLTGKTENSFIAETAWTGKEYGITYLKTDGPYSSISFRLASEDGASISSEMTVVDKSPFVWDPSLAWTGQEFGLAYHDTDLEKGERGFFFKRISDKGNPLDKGVLVAEANGFDSSQQSIMIVWNGTEYGAVWNKMLLNNNNSFDVYFRRFSVKGETKGPEIQITNNNGKETKSIMPALAWTGKNYSIAWADYDINGSGIETAQRYYFAKLSENGNLDGQIVKVADFVPIYHKGNEQKMAMSNRSFSLAWADTEYGFAWISGFPVNGNEDNEDIYFRRISETGALIGAETKVSNYNYNSNPHLVSTGNGYALSWNGYSYNDNDYSFKDHHNSFIQISKTGDLVGKETQIPGVLEDPGSFGYKWMAYTGKEYGMVWTEYYRPSPGIGFNVEYFTHLGCTQ